MRRCEHLYVVCAAASAGKEYRVDGKARSRRRLERERWIDVKRKGYGRADSQTRLKRGQLQNWRPLVSLGTALVSLVLRDAMPDLQERLRRHFVLPSLSEWSACARGWYSKF